MKMTQNNLVLPTGVWNQIWQTRNRAELIKHEVKKMKQIQTNYLGGIRNVTVDDLKAMQDGDYILYAQDRLLTKVPVEKSRLPFDPEFHPQGGEIFRASDQLIYVRQATFLSKSTDGGRTWKSWKIERREEIADKWQVLNDGMFIRASMTVGEGANEPAKVYRSHDEGQTWEQITEIPIEVPGGYQTRYSHWRMTKLPDDTLLLCMDLRDEEYGGDRFLSAGTVLTAYRSDDKGETWEGPIKVCEWVAEGGIAQLPSGQLLASVRYQRPLLPSDSPFMREVSGDKRGFKHHFLIDSNDGGRTWKNLRPLTTVYGQCYGYPAALSDGMVVVIHDTRYGPGPDAARAMISRDEGKTWEDEVYYVFFGEGGTGYSESVVLDDDTILTVGGTSTHPDAKRYWHASIGHSHLTAIRWKPVKSREGEAPAEPQSPIKVENAKHQRQEALSQRRRIIFNDDTYELSRDDANTPEGFLKRRLKPLVGTHVDSIFWSVLGGWADAPAYDSKVQPIYGDAHGGPPGYWQKVTENVKTLIRTGRCPLQIVIDFAHENDMELFASVRMNDSHDSFIPGGVTLWKKEHPEFLVDSGEVPKDKDSHPLGLYVIAQDFTHQEVRDRKFEIIEEICRRYDIDGINLNYIRHPVFFSNTMRGEPVTTEEIEIMTRFMRRIRKFTDEQGVRRGRPILVATIVPDNFQLGKNVGLDIETWIKEDLIDIVIPGLGYAPFSLPVSDFTEMAQQYGVRVYPCINRKAPQHVPDEAVSEGFRGVATNWYRVGADGIFFWNLGTPFEYKYGQELITIRNRYYAALPELGEAETLIGKDKLFCVDDGVLNYYQHVSSQRPLPIQLTQEFQQISFEVGDDVQAAEKQGRISQLTLNLLFRGPAQEQDLHLRFNSKPLQTGEIFARDAEELEINYRLSTAQVKLGKNVLEVSLKESPDTAEKSIKLDGIKLWVRYSAD